MPCNCDYMEQSDFEKRISQTVALINYLIVELQFKRRKIKDEQYWSKAQGNKYVAELCSILSNLSPSKREDLLYAKPKDKVRRQLADWWEEHEEEDKKREKREKLAQRQKQLKKAALSKLTPEEIKALNI